jgi:hypothetical protein
MITKTLRSSGGDYSTLADVLTWINTTDGSGAFTSQTLSDDVLINVQGGQVFGDLGTPNYPGYGSGSWDWNSHSITFQTAPGEEANPGILLGYWSLQPQTLVGPGLLEFDKIICEATGIQSTKAFCRIQTATTPPIVKIRNSVLCLKASDNSIFIMAQNSNKLSSCVLNNCSVFVTGVNQVSTVNCYNTSTGPSFTNNVFCVNSSNQVAFDLDTLSIDNTVFNYGSGGVTATGTATITISDPAFAVAMVQSYDESVVTIGARSADLTSLSTACIDNADPATAETVDILGRSR